MLTAVDSGKRLFDTALAAGKKVIVVTDIYFDQAFIAEILQRHGDGAARAIYTSSAYGQSKAEGELYDRVLRELGVLPRQVLHVGDNQLVDVTVALGKGMRAWFVPTSKQRLKWRHGLGALPSGNLC